MEELTYKNIMSDLPAFEAWLSSANINETVRTIEKMDTAGAQIVMGLIEQHKIAITDLSEALQKELSFLGVSNG